jgi:hypothetical protein
MGELNPYAAPAPEVVDTAEPSASKAARIAGGAFAFLAVQIFVTLAAVFWQGLPRHRLSGETWVTWIPFMAFGGATIIMTAWLGILLLAGRLRRRRLALAYASLLTLIVVAGGLATRPPHQPVSLAHVLAFARILAFLGVMIAALTGRPSRGRVRVATVSGMIFVVTALGGYAAMLGQ